MLRSHFSTFPLWIYPISTIVYSKILYNNISNHTKYAILVLNLPPQDYRVKKEWETLVVTLQIPRILNTYKQRDR